MLANLKNPMMAFLTELEFLNIAYKALVPLSLSLILSCATLSFPYFSIFVFEYAKLFPQTQGLSPAVLHLESPLEALSPNLFSG